MTNGIIDSGQEIVTNGLVLHLDAAQRRSYSGTGTTWTDLSGNGNNGTLTNGPTFNPANGGSIQFDGTNDYVNVSNQFMANFTAFTYEAFVRIGVNNSGGNIMTYSAPSLHTGPQFYWTNTELGLVHYNGGGNRFLYSYKGGLSINKDLYYHVVATWTNGVINLYINGEKQTGLITSSLGASIINVYNDATVSYKVGVHRTDQAFYKGDIAVARVYNRVLSDAEVLQNYNATKARFQVPALLDLYPNAAAAYSLRKLRSGYTGSAIRVRRSSDNTEQDIGFTSTGDLDTTALTTFVGANNGFVSTWYDQSGTNNNATQATLDGQPLIVSSGVIVSENGKPSVYFSNGNTVYLAFTSVINTGTFTILWVSKKDNTTAQGSIVLSGSRNGVHYMGDDIDNQGNPTAFSGTSGGIIRTSIGNTSSSGNEILQHLSYLNRKNFTQAVGQYNNSTNSYNNNVTSTSAIIDSIAYYGLNYNYVGKIQEIIIYSLDKSENRQGISENINSYYGIYNPTVVTMDTDAQAFITAAGITDLVQQGAINTLVKTLKDVNLWSKMKAIYPFVGGTAAAHKFNLKDPRDLDAAFRLSFVNAWTHASTGALPNSTNGYADTFLNLQNNFTTFDNHFSFYYRTTSADGAVLDGKVGAAASNYENGMSAHAGRGSVFNDNMGRVQATNAYYGNMRAFHCSTLTSQTSMKFFRNTQLISSGVANAASTYPSLNFYFGAVNSAGTATFFQPLELTFGSIGTGLSDSEVRNLYSAVQTFQTTLGRQV